jgi:hypothetical protein
VSKRSAEVELKLHAAQFRAEVRASKRDVKDLDDSVEGLDADVKKLPPDALKAAAALKALGAESGAAKVKLEDFGRRSTVLGDLEHRLASARAEVRRLADEFNRTGNTTTFLHLNLAQGNLKQLEGVKKSLTGALEQGAKDAGPKIGDLLSTGIGSSKLGPGVAIAIAAASPMIATAAASAVLAGIGLAGIGGAVAVQLRDPKVIAAGTGLGQHVLDGLTQATSAFQPVLLRTIARAGTAFDQLQPRLTKMFDALAVPAEQLGSGLINTISAAMPGILRAADAAGPLITELAQDLPLLGTAIGSFASEMASVGPEARQFLRDTISGVSTFITYAGQLTSTLAQVYGFLKEWDPYVRLLTSDSNNQAYTKTVTAVGAVGSQAELTDQQLADLATQMAKTTATADSLASAMTTKLLQSMLGLDQANLSVAQSQTRVAATLKENGRQLDIHTAKGQANREMILSAVAANVQQYQAMIASGASSKEAADAYDANTAALERQLRKAGLTAKQVDGLIGKYRGVPGQVDTAIAMNGLTQAINDLNTLLRLLNGLPPLKTINVKYSAPPPPGKPQNSNAGGKKSGGGKVMYASGGLPAVGQPYWVGENGPELRLDYQPGRILSHSDSMAAVRSGTGAGRPAPSVINLHATFVDGVTGEVLHRRLITYAGSTGQAPSDLWPDQRR